MSYHVRIMFFNVLKLLLCVYDANVSQTTNHVWIQQLALVKIIRLKEIHGFFYKQRQAEIGQKSRKY